MPSRPGEELTSITTGPWLDLRISTPATFSPILFPGLEGIEKATGKDVAGMIIAFLEKNAKAKKTKTRGKG